MTKDKLEVLLKELGCGEQILNNTGYLLGLGDGQFLRMIVEYRDIRRKIRSYLFSQALEAQVPVELREIIENF